MYPLYVPGVVTNASVNVNSPVPALASVTVQATDAIRLDTPVQMSVPYISNVTVFPDNGTGVVVRPSPHALRPKM